MYDENGNEVKRGGCLKWVGIAVLVLVVLLVIGSIMGGNDKSSQSSSDATSQSAEKSKDKKEEKKDKKLSVGETAEIDGIKFTVNSVEFTDQRNQFAETNPERVIKISYTLENGQNKDYAFGADTQLYVDGKKAKTYPLGGTDGDVGFGSVSAGRTVDSTVYYGVDGKDIELEWQPLFSVGNKAIWKLDK
ncbi:DUF4352 domain-containing protein [Aerococcus tenax]|uniref:DUF4352 domain-containing protein n=1 Tax=Aerococcus tenax TaxID=3078812 RepID=UPI000DCF2B66|nr:DUF4352 domain-containing protein [Aerococcus tenax]WIW73992.1 DUF4352 domain-containing protein [Aerococcus tenax]